MSDYDQLLRTRDHLLKYGGILVGGCEWNVSWDSINREVRVYCFQGDGHVCFSCGEREEAICRVADAFYMSLEAMKSGGQMTLMRGNGGVFFFRFKTARVITEDDRLFGMKELGI